MTGITTQETRRYRLRVATKGADVVEGNVEFVLDLGYLTDAPVLTRNRVHPLQRGSEMRPFDVELVDIGDDTVTEAHSSGGRWFVIGRLLDVQYQTDGGGSPDDEEWVTYGTGRYAEWGEPEKPGTYRGQVADEGWKARKSRLFTQNDTCQLLPAGIRYPWRGFPAALVGTGGAVRVPETGLVSVNLMMGGSLDKQRGIMPTQRLIDFIRSDAYPENEIITDNNFPERGNFRHVRFNYDGVDYEVTAFGPRDNPLVGSLEEPVVIGADSANRTIFVAATILVPIELEIGVDIPEEAPAFIWAPTRPPEPGFPLHLGVDSATHAWGNAGGYIHIADEQRRAWEEVGLVYSAERMAELEADLSFPAQAGYVERVVEDVEAFFTEERLTGNFLVPGRDVFGRRKLIDLRPPRIIPPDLPILTPENSWGTTWRLAGRDMRNKVAYKVVKLSAAHQARTYIGSFLDAVDVALGGVGRVEYSVADGARLDGLVAKEETFEPEDGTADTIQDAGVRELILDHRSSAWPGSPDGGGFGGAIYRAIVAAQIYASGRGIPFQDVEKFLTPATLALFRDGLITGVSNVLGDLADTIEEGDLLWLDNELLQLPDPGPVGALPPTAGEQNPGGEAPELEDPPTLGTPVLNSNLTITVPVDTIPTGLVARVEHAITIDGVTPPGPEAQIWRSSGTRETPGDVTVPRGTRKTFVWIHTYGFTEEDGLRRTTFSTPVVVEIPAWPDFLAVDLVPVPGSPGVYATLWTPGELTLGVRLMWDEHDAADEPTFSGSADIEASVGTYQFPAIALNNRLTVQLQAYSGWDDSPGAVSGTLGETIRLSRLRQETPRDQIPGSHAFADHSDSSALAGADDDDIPQFNASTQQWEPVAPGALSAHDIEDHDDVDTTGRAAGDLFGWDGTDHVYKRPALGVRLTSSSPGNATNSDQTVPFDAAAFDDAGFWDSGTPNRLTIPTGLGGLYLVHFSSGVTTSSTASRFIARVRLGGTTTIGPSAQSNRQATTNVATQAGASFLYRFAAGDFIELRDNELSGSLARVSGSISLGLVRFGD